MDKELKKLYEYCKSQGYQGSTEEFEQELKSLIIEEVDTNELSEIAGGNKLTRAAAASLVSALSIASPFASAHPNSFSIKPNGETISRSTVDVYKEKIMQLSSREALKSYKNKIVDGVNKGVNYAMQNKKTLKSILLKGVLPAGALVVGTPVLVGTGIFIKNKINDNSPDSKTRRFLTQALVQSFNDCAEYCNGASLDKKREIYDRLDISNKIDNFYTARNICACILGYGGNENADFTIDSRASMSYDAIKDSICNKLITENGGKFDINEGVIEKYLWHYTKNDDSNKKIIDPNGIIMRCFHNSSDNSKQKFFGDLRQKVENDKNIQESMQALEKAVNDLKQSVEDSPQPPKPIQPPEQPMGSLFPQQASIQHLTPPTTPPTAQAKPTPVAPVQAPSITLDVTGTRQTDTTSTHAPAAPYQPQPMFPQHVPQFQFTPHPAPPTTPPTAQAKPTPVAPNSVGLPTPPSTGNNVAPVPVVHDNHNNPPSDNQPVEPPAAPSEVPLKGNTYQPSETTTIIQPTPTLGPKSSESKKENSEKNESPSPMTPVSQQGQNDALPSPPEIDPNICYDRTYNFFNQLLVYSIDKFTEEINCHPEKFTNLLYKRSSDCIYENKIVNGRNIEVTSNFYTFSKINRNIFPEQYTQSIQNIKDAQKRFDNIVEYFKVHPFSQNDYLPKGIRNCFNIPGIDNSTNPELAYPFVIEKILTESKNDNLWINLKYYSKEVIASIDRFEETANRILAQNTPVLEDNILMPKNQQLLNCLPQEDLEKIKTSVIKKMQEMQSSYKDRSMRSSGYNGTIRSARDTLYCIPEIHDHILTMIENTKDINNLIEQAEELLRCETSMSDENQSTNNPSRMRDLGVSYWGEMYKRCYLDRFKKELVTNNEISQSVKELREAINQFNMASTNCRGIMAELLPHNDSDKKFVEYKERLETLSANESDFHRQLIRKLLPRELTQHEQIDYRNKFKKILARFSDPGKIEIINNCITALTTKPHEITNRYINEALRKLAFTSRSADMAIPPLLDEVIKDLESIDSANTLSGPYNKLNRVLIYALKSIKYQYVMIGKCGYVQSLADVIKDSIATSFKEIPRSLYNSSLDDSQQDAKRIELVSWLNLLNNVLKCDKKLAKKQDELSHAQNKSRQQHIKRQIESWRKKKDAALTSMCNRDYTAENGTKEKIDTIEKAQQKITEIEQRLNKLCQGN